MRNRPPQQLSCATEMDEDVEFSPLPAEILRRKLGIWGDFQIGGFGCLLEGGVRLC